MDRLTVPSDYAHTVITSVVTCCKCDYDLRGLRPNGRCPECGHEIWPSIVEALDPTASRLPTIANPRQVGNGLLWLTFCVLGAIVCLLAGPMAVLIDRSGVFSGFYLQSLLPGWIGSGATFMALAGLLSVWLMKPRADSTNNDRVIGDMVLLAVSLVGWAGAAYLWKLVHVSGDSSLKIAMTEASLCLFGAGIFISLRGTLSVIGQRSRRYRTSAARQGAENMLYALAGALVGMMFHNLARFIDLPGPWRMLGTAITSVCLLMLVIGQVYLVMNAVWIRRSLLKPPPTLDEVLAPPMPADVSVVLDEEDAEKPDESQPGSEA